MRFSHDNVFRDSSAVLNDGCLFLCPGRRCGRDMHDHGWVDTQEGGHIVCPGDWVITGVAGEHYPCKPDIFEATYELVEE